MRRLIINADDFGLTNGVNRAIAEAHSRGVVTSATLMACGSARDESVLVAASLPKLSIGCHIVLVDGAPILQAGAVDTLLEHASLNEPRFRSSLGRFAARALVGRLDSQQLQAEATAQIHWLQEQGLPVIHFDTHKHTHIFPQVLRPLLLAAKACGVHALRNPFGPRLPLSLHDVRRSSLWKRFLEVKLLSAFASSFRRSVRETGMRTPDGCFGVVATGSLDLELFEAIVQCIPDGTWEFVCHPGYNDAELASVRTRLRESRQKELEVLTSSVAREILDRRGIQLISYSEL